MLRKKMIKILIPAICVFQFCDLAFCTDADKIQKKQVNIISANKIIDDFKSKIAKNPNDIETRTDLGVFYFQLQEYTLAAKIFKGVLEIDSKNAVVHYNYGKTLISMGDKISGIVECEKALNMGLDDINVYRTLATEYFDRRELKKALDMYENIKRLDPTDDSAYYASGFIYGMMGDGYNASEQFKKTIEINPSNAEAHYELGWLYAKSKPDFAMKEFKKTLEINPNHESARRELETFRKKTGGDPERKIKNRRFTQPSTQ